LVIGPSLCGEVCPAKEYCQSCCSDEIKSVSPDYICFDAYGDVDLNDDPCLFLDCGHIITRSSMDAQMGLERHYEMSSDGRPCAVRQSAQFSIDDIKTCPICRGSLRGIARYGAIIRRAMLDEGTKRLISWARNELAQLSDEYMSAESRLRENLLLVHKQKYANSFILKGTPSQIRETIFDSMRSHGHKALRTLEGRLGKYLATVQKDSQPFQRVADLVQQAKRKGKVLGEFNFGEAQSQTSLRLDGLVLLLNLDFSLISNYLDQDQDWNGKERDIDLSEYQGQCENIVASAKESKQYRIATQGYILCAKFCYLSMRYTKQPDDQQKSLHGEVARPKIVHFRDKGRQSLMKAKSMLLTYPSTRRLQPEVDIVSKMLQGSTFYTAVSAKEVRQVYNAMAAEFRGTGHWYRCVNGHPFTIGECGRPMEEARCPECGSPIGGDDHIDVDGVSHAADIESLGAAIDLVRF
jgi:hypothetical protein